MEALEGLQENQSRNAQEQKRPPWPSAGRGDCIMWKGMPQLSQCTRAHDMTWVNLRIITSHFFKEQRHTVSKIHTQSLKHARKDLYLIISVVKYRQVLGIESPNYWWLQGGQEKGCWVQEVPRGLGLYDVFKQESQAHVKYGRMLRFSKAGWW